MMTRILTVFCLAFCTMLRAASLPVSFNTTTHKIAAPLDLWTVNSAEIYNGLGLAGMSLQSPSSVSITGGSIAGVAGLGYTANPLSQFAATISAQLFGVISDETGGTGVLVGNDSPTFTGTVKMPAGLSLVSSADTDTGFNWVGGNEIRVATGGSTRLTVNDSMVSVGSAIPLSLGNAAPAVYGGGDTDTGLAWPSGNVLNFYTGGSVRGSFRDTGLNLGASTDTILSSGGAGILRIGGADAAAPHAQTIQLVSVAAGTTDTAAPNATIKAPAGTGTGAGGRVIIQVAPAGSSGSSQNSYANLWQMTSTGQMYIGSAAAPPQMFPFSGNAYTSPSIGSSGLGWFSGQASGNNETSFAYSGNAVTATSGSGFTFSIARTFQPTSGTATHTWLNVSPTVNQTGGANGVTRGLYVSPTLTAAADFRAIEVSGGSIVLPKTVTASGTTGDQTINKITGSVNFAAAATSLVVTDSYVTANSIIICTVGSNDSTMKSVAAVAGSGSFTLYPNAAPTAETRVNFFITN